MAREFRVRAIKHGQWQGQAFRPGDTAVMREDIAQAYAAMNQVVILGQVEPPPAAPIGAALPAAERPGPPVETGAKTRRERRRKR